MTKTNQLVIRLSDEQKERLKSLAKNNGRGCASYIINKLRLDKGVKK